ncbi:MAG: dienelactone hydrolase family protein [Parasporobacterium sp.]|nr:dienelactone hydrolase family protein [Parasporobacterium sp.]
MKKLLVMLLAAIMVMSLFSITAMAEPAGEAAEEEIKQADPKDIGDYLWELSTDMSDEDFYKYSQRNYKFVQSLEPMVDADTFHALYVASVHAKQKKDGYKEEFMTAQENLILTQSVADGVYFLWDADNMPCLDGEEFTEEELDEGVLDSYGFIPLLIKCLLEDPTQAKGNIIVVSGGGMTNRSNSGEAYPAIEVFNNLGYNVFVLQRRIRPYSDEDIFMDMQRSIRMVRYYAEKEGWGGQDMIADCGWSGGAATVMGPVNNLYGDLNPTKYCSTYVPDEIDAVNSDTDVTMPIYGGHLDEDCENPNIPAMYMCAGSEDETGAADHIQEVYNRLVELGIPARIDIFEGAGHGFGVGQEGALKGTEECALWPGYADEFMMANKGHSTGAAPAELPEADTAQVPEAIAEDAAPAEEGTDGDIPADYTQVKVFDGTYGFGDAEITAYTNDDQTAFYLTWEAFDENQILEGTVEDGIVDVTYDLTGFMTGDAQLIWDDAVASAQEWVAR